MRVIFVFFIVELFQLIVNAFPVFLDLERN